MAILVLSLDLANSLLNWFTITPFATCVCLFWSSRLEKIKRKVHSFNILVIFVHAHTICQFKCGFHDVIVLFVRRSLQSIDCHEENGARCTAIEGLNQCHQEGNSVLLQTTTQHTHCHARSPPSFQLQCMIIHMMKWENSYMRS